MSHAITPNLKAAADLSRGDRADMLALLDQHFDGITPSDFDRDLSEKSHALLLRDAAGRLVGLSTLLIYATRAGGEMVGVACSGDTVVDPSAWNSPTLPREWIRAVRALRPVPQDVPYYWLLLTGGFRTYRLLSTFWRDFYPQNKSSDMKALLDALASDRYGDPYDPAAGVVRFPRPQILRPHLAGIPPERLADPHVATFAALNPGHAVGDELACLCDLSDENLTRAGRRMVGA